jgi:Mg/Co/Ni transporter MgtE
MQTNIASNRLVAPPPTELAQASRTAHPVGARARVAVKVPSWFTSGAALRVAELKGVEYLLVVDRRVVVGTAARRALAAVRPDEPLARSMVASSAAVSPELSLDEARALMSTLGLDCLPVTSGPLLVGVITREDLTEQDQRAAG